MDYKILLRNGRYALLETQTQYVIACGFNETYPKGQQWGHGYYYSHWNESENKKIVCLQSAIERFRMLTEPNYISRYRFEELATQLKDGLIKYDEESAMEYFDEVCEMTDEEKQWFGIIEEPCQ
ncbi:MAG: hypothetical protein IJA10_10650 [Lachnospiraceae bacterium]|nr:hypothetical protein [Lachnospiraceae bacterium]